MVASSLSTIVTVQSVTQKRRDFVTKHGSMKSICTKYIRLKHNNIFMILIINTSILSRCIDINTPCILCITISYH